MGGGSSKEKLASKEIERQLKDTATREANKVKLLLLGAGESGKSTVFKQMKILYGAGLSPEEAQLITPVVHSNMLSLLKTVQDQVTAFGRHGDVSRLGLSMFCACKLCMFAVGRAKRISSATKFGRRGSAEP